MLRRLPAFLALLLPLGAAAQSSGSFGFEPRGQAIPVLANGDSLRHAWSGGLNSPLYSHLDLNGDGQQDLFVFERMTGRVVTYLNVAAPGGGRRWRHAPGYESAFPSDLANWALLRDYDCDGRPDLFTQALLSGDVRVFRNVASADGRPRFQLAVGTLLCSQLDGVSRSPFNVNLNSYDVPAISDMDGDGKLDLLTFAQSGSKVYYYHNISPACGGLDFNAMQAVSWADIFWCGTSATSYSTTNTSCRPATPDRVNHTVGSGLLLQDFDNDGDQDLLVGRDGYSGLAFFRNTGTAAVATTTSGVTPTLPNGIGTVTLPNFPVAHAIDANLDGKKDLVVAAGLLDNADYASLRQNGLWFANTGTDALPTYVRQTGPFLQSQMIDVSEGAATAFGDIDGDGRVDMLVANTADQYGNIMTNSAYRATIAYYRNVGTAAQPAFSLVTNDYLGLSARSFRNIRPVFADLNRDGVKDLAFSAYYIGSTFVFYYLNAAPAGAAMSFDATQMTNLNGVGAGDNTTPCFADVDGDGYEDILIGTNDYYADGGLSYYRRTPTQTVLADAYTLVSNDYGSLRLANGDRPYYVSPAVADVDGDGTPDLMTVDYTGAVHMYANYRAQTAPLFDRTDLVINPVTSQYEAIRLGYSNRGRNHLTLADLNADGSPELVIGTESGGLLLYGTRNRLTTSTRAAAEALPLQVYPNPAQDQVTVQTPTATRVLLRDLLGRVVRPATPDAQRQHQLNVQNLPAGVYLLEATDATGRRGVQRLTVK